MAKYCAKCNKFFENDGVKFCSACGSSEFFAVALLSVIDVLICPIFFDYYVQKKPQLLFPNTYYINSVHSNIYLRYSLVYTAVLTLVLVVFYLRKRKI